MIFKKNLLFIYNKGGSYTILESTKGGCEVRQRTLKSSGACESEAVTGISGAVLSGDQTSEILAGGHVPIHFPSIRHLHWELSGGTHK